MYSCSSENINLAFSVLINSPNFMLAKSLQMKFMLSWTDHYIIRRLTSIDEPRIVIAGENKSYCLLLTCFRIQFLESWNLVNMTICSSPYRFNATSREVFGGIRTRFRYQSALFGTNAAAVCLILETFPSISEIWCKRKREPQKDMNTRCVMKIVNSENKRGKSSAAV